MNNQEGYSSYNSSNNSHCCNSKVEIIKKTNFFSWSTVFLLITLSLIGGCFYSFSNAMSDIYKNNSKITTGPSVGVLVIDGEITGSLWATEIINNFKQDNNIKAIVLRINSPGGAVAPCQEIYQELIKVDKPIVVSMGSIAASGGLYIAAAADEIWANPGTLTGSIGVIMQTFNIVETMKKIGVSPDVIVSGNYKDMASPFREMRPDERALLQAMTNEVYEQFVADLVKGKKHQLEYAKNNPYKNTDVNETIKDRVPLEIDKVEKKIKSLADGRIFTGSDAYANGLVDIIGSFEDAVDRAADLGNIQTDDFNIVMEDGRGSWWERVLYSKASFLGFSLNNQPESSVSLKWIYYPGITTLPAVASQLAN